MITPLATLVLAMATKISWEQVPYLAIGFRERVVILVTIDVIGHVEMD